MTQAAKILGKVRRGVQSVAYGNPLYQKILSAGDTPTRLHFTPPDPWPGDAKAGQAMLSGQTCMFGLAEDVSLRRSADALRNLRAVGTEAARAACVRLIDTWMRQYDRWDKDEWMPEHLGARIAAWIGFYDFYCSAGPEEFNQRLVASLHRQWKHLARTASTALKGIEAVQSARGLIYGGLNFPEGDSSLGLACDMLQRQIQSEILPDGGHISRNPSVQLHLLRHLVDIRNVFSMADIRLPESIGIGLASLIPAVKFYRHGDGGLCLFNGAVEETPLLIDAVLTQAVVRGRVLRRLPETGYERLTAGRSLLLVDAGSPPPRAYGADGHAGLLSFEFSVGRERLIVNCGAVPPGNNEWRAACSATAAHSTITLQDKNACELDDDGSITGRVVTSTQRFEDESGFGIEMAHNGYLSSLGLTHTRLLKLSPDGEALTGREVLHGSRGKAFALRWHLHPTVQVSLLQNGQAALLRTPSGSGWRLRVHHAGIGLEPSVYCGDANPRRTMQIKTAGITDDGETVITWSLSRERKS